MFIFLMADLVSISGVSVYLKHKWSTGSMTQCSNIPGRSISYILSQDSAEPLLPGQLVFAGPKEYEVQYNLKNDLVTPYNNCV